jgi:hypothetical protein
MVPGPEESILSLLSIDMDTMLMGSSAGAGASASTLPEFRGEEPCRVSLLQADRILRSRMSVRTGNSGGSTYVFRPQVDVGLVYSNLTYALEVVSGVPA